MKAKPETFSNFDPQLYYVMKLCQAETTVTGATTWIKELDNLLQSNPDARDRMSEADFNAFNDLAAVAHITKALATTLALPSAKLKKSQDQIYSQTSKDLSSEIDGLKTALDLSEYVIPIDNLLEPGVASSALQKLEHFIVEKTGTRIGLLYEDLIDSCISEVLLRCEQVKTEEQTNIKASDAALSSRIIPALEDKIKQRKQKEKTRPPHSSAYDIIAPAGDAGIVAGETPEPIKVKQSSHDVFATLFTKGYSRGSINWTAFKAAMVDIGFFRLPHHWIGDYIFSPKSLLFSTSNHFASSSSL